MNTAGKKRKKQLAGSRKQKKPQKEGKVTHQEGAVWRIYAMQEL
jgi:hypothetical protein